MSGDLESITRYRAAVGSLLYWDTTIPEPKAPAPKELKKLTSLWRKMYGPGSPKLCDPEWRKRFKAMQPERRKAATRELSEAMPAVLGLFRKHHCDASAVYRFWFEETNVVNPTPEHFRASDVRAALSNLELHAFGNTETPPPAVHEKAMLILNLLNGTFQKIGTIAAAAKSQDICSDRGTVSKYVDQLELAKLAERNPAGNVRRLTVSP